MQQPAYHVVDLFFFSSFSLGGSPTAAARACLLGLASNLMARGANQDHSHLAFWPALRPLPASCSGARDPPSHFAMCPTVLCPALTPCQFPLPGPPLVAAFMTTHLAMPMAKYAARTCWRVNRCVLRVFSSSPLGGVTAHGTRHARLQWKQVLVVPTAHTREREPLKRLSRLRPARVILAPKRGSHDLYP